MKRGVLCLNRHHFERLGELLCMFYVEIVEFFALYAKTSVKSYRQSSRDVFSKYLSNFYQLFKAKSTCPPHKKDEAIATPTWWKFPTRNCREQLGIWKIWEHVAVVIIDNHVTSVILMTVRERYRGGAKAIHSTYDLDSEHISRVQWHNTKFTKIHLPIV